MVVSTAKVVSLQSKSDRAAARRRAAHRADATIGHPSLLDDPLERASAEEIAAVVRDIDAHRTAAGSHTTARATPATWHHRITGVAEFIQQRITGNHAVDEFGFDPRVNDAILLPMLRPLFRSWFRVQVTGIENLPETGAALVVANHAGVLPIDALMTSVAVHDQHPAHRDLRLPAADTERLLAAGELTAVFPEGYRGLGKSYANRYKLQRFGGHGFVSAALRVRAPIVPCSIVGSEEIYPMIADVKPLARLLGLPYFPITPLFPLAGPLGLVPLPSKWHIDFGTPISTAEYDESAADDPMVSSQLSDQVRETVQQNLYKLLARRAGK